MPSEKEILDKYQKRLAEQYGKPETETTSREYKSFRKSFLPYHLSFYEKACNISGKVFKLKITGKQQKNLEENIKICHLNIIPEGAFSFAIIAAFSVILLGLIIGFGLLGSMFITLMLIISGLILFYAMQKLPEFFANNWRLKASNQMIQAVFYIVTYMKHTSNLERAIGFAADHVEAPLSLDLRKVLWDIETEEYEHIKDSLDSYLESWRKWNPEFIEAMNLIESSLYESSESRRLDLLDKALTRILSETYDKMLRFAHNLQSPITMLHMLGVILPILGLVILPLMVSFLSSDASPGLLALNIGVLYNLLLPIGVFYLGKIILSKRPTGQGAGTDIPVKANQTPLLIGGFVLALFVILGLMPLFIHLFNPTFDITSGSFDFLGYICPSGGECAISEKIGPFGLGAALFSLFIITGLGIGTGIYYRLRSKNVIKIRKKTNKLETEFSTALFQLGNTLADGAPVEIAFQKVQTNLTGTNTGKFFSMVSQNMTGGMGVEEAIFDPRKGALKEFPSKLIESSMKVMIESSKKGPRIAAQALLSMSQYMKEIRRLNERLKDLLAEVISSMKSQISFLTPAIAGIVIGITSMITTILGKLSSQLGVLSEGSQSVSGGLGDIVGLFGTGVPTYYFQIIVGIYVVQITYILTVLSNNIENGFDKTTERYLLGRNMINSTGLYIFISGTVILIFNLVAANILKGTLG